MKYILTFPCDLRVNYASQPTTQHLYISSIYAHAKFNILDHFSRSSPLIRLLCLISLSKNPLLVNNHPEKKERERKPPNWLASIQVTSLRYADLQDELLLRIFYLLHHSDLHWTSADSGREDIGRR